MERELRVNCHNAPHIWRLRACLGAVFFFVWTLATPEQFFFPRFMGGGDDATYVAYAMSAALDGDLDFSNEIAGQLIVSPNGQIRPVHPAGPGLVAAPLVAIFSVGDRLTEHPVVDDRAQLGGSWSYFGFFLASASALIIGLLLTSRSVLSLTATLSPKFLTIVLAGTGIPYYGLKRFTMGHSFEFFAAGIILLAVVRFRRANCNPLLSAMSIGAGVALSLLVRPANVNVTFLPALVYFLMQLFPSNLTSPRIKAAALRWIATGTLLGVVFTFASNSALYGTLYPSFGQQYLSSEVRENSQDVNQGGIGATSPSLASSINEFVVDTTPRAMTAFGRLSDLSTIVFAQEYGLLWFMPIVPVGGLLLLLSLIVVWRQFGQRRYVMLVMLLSIAYVTVPLGVVLVWQSHASSFGFRYLFSLVPLGLLGLALWSSLAKGCLMPALRLTHGSLVLLAVFSLMGQIFHGSVPELALGNVAENAFGRSVPWGNPSFASSLVWAHFQSDTWSNMLARGMLGFVALVFLPIESIATLGSATGVIPRRRAESLVELVSGYSNELSNAAPGTIAATLLAFGILVPIAVAWLVRGTRTEADMREEP